MPPFPSDLPGSPNIAYKGRGWVSWGDFLGTGNVYRQGGASGTWRSYEDAAKFVQGVGIAGVLQYRYWAKGEVPWAPPFPSDLPRNPSLVYKGKGWTSWGDFLGTGRRYGRRRAWRPYEDTSAFAQLHGIRSGDHWDDWCAGRVKGLPPRPEDIPADPALAYRGCGWSGWGAFLGTGSKSYDYYRAPKRSFEEARMFARTTGVTSAAGWAAYYAGKFPGAAPCPDDIPSQPHLTYKGKGWVSWPDFLGTEEAAGGAAKPSDYALLEVFLQ